jgi:SNW domain-containing protein 1
LEMRLAADGRTLQQHTINEKFAGFADSIYIGERQVRKEIEERNKVLQSVSYHDYLRREEELGVQAKKAMEEKQKVLEQHMDRSKLMKDEDLSEKELDALKKRDLISYMIKREKQQEIRQATSGHSKSKLLRDQERDVGEKIALGQAQPSSNDVIHDQSLYNRTQGLSSGFKDDEENSVFDKPLWENRQATNIYGGLKDIGNEYTHEEEKPDVERVLNRKVGKGFEGAESRMGSRTRPVEFEKVQDDLFGMSGFLEGQKKLKKE